MPIRSVAGLNVAGETETSRTSFRIETASHPRSVWAICTIARSGSSWLSQLVSSTGIMGRPDEYVLDWQRQAAKLGFSRETSFEEYLWFLLRERSTPNGTFAIKGSVEELQPFFDFFPNAPCVWLMRENRVAQAVSWHRAQDGGMWTRAAVAKNRPAFVYSIERILYFYDEICRRETLWNDFFLHRTAQPLILTYEEVCRDPLDAVHAIASYIGVDSEKITNVSSAMKIVRDETTEEWTRRAEQAIRTRSLR